MDVPHRSDERGGAQETDTGNGPELRDNQGLRRDDLQLSFDGADASLDLAEIRTRAEDPAPC